VLIQVVQLKTAVQLLKGTPLESVKVLGLDALNVTKPAPELNCANVQLTPQTLPVELWAMV
jgi:hypothetical protein